MSYTLNGLVDKFKELMIAIRVRDTPITFEDIYDKFLDEELICNVEMQGKKTYKSLHSWLKIFVVVVLNIVVVKEAIVVATAIYSEAILMTELSA